MANQTHGGIIATYPLDEGSIAVVFSSGNDAETTASSGVCLLSGLPITVREIAEFSSLPTVIANVELTDDTPGSIDRVVARGLGPAIGGQPELTGPPFIHGIQSPLNLKIPIYHE